MNFSVWKAKNIIKVLKVIFRKTENGHYLWLTTKKRLSKIYIGYNRPLIIGVIIGRIIGIGCFNHQLYAVSV